MNPKVRYPAVAEAFYPADTHELDTLVTALLEQDAPAHLSGKKIRAAIVPHAGYQYSGRISACAFKAVGNQEYRTVYLIGNAHAYLFEGIALDGHESWHSPLGNVPVNKELNDRLRALAPELIYELDIAHHSDHILEVLLPFLQRALKPGYSILPMLFGENSPDIHHRAADILISVLDNNDLVLVSTDLSHYPSYQEATAIDRATLDYVIRKDLEGLEEHERKTMNRAVSGEITLFCGPDALKTLLVIAARLGWQAEQLCYNNSGDAPHDDKRAVVGYGTVIFYET
jgi:AmmeMemoRadiSam system protein B